MSGHMRLVFGWGHGAGKTRTQARSRLGVHDIPHLGFPPSAVPLGSQPIVGMHLDRQVLTGVDELHQQRELPSVPRIVGLADQRPPVTPDKFRQAHTRQRPLGHHRFASGNARQLPAFAHTPGSGGDPLEGYDPLSAPEGLFEQRSEFEWIHRSSGSLLQK